MHQSNSDGESLNIVVADAAGFCFGVERSLRLAQEALAGHASPVCSLGPLIHNPQVIQELEEQGLTVINDPQVAESGTVVIRSHGVGPSAFERLKESGVEVTDGTCPFVGKAQRHAAKLVDEGYKLIVVGEHDHPEVRGIVEHARGQAIVAESADDMPEELGDRVGIVVQTTQSSDTLQEIVARAATVCSELRVFNTICSATTERQEAAVAVAKKVDLMLVIGGRNSGNTRRLVQLCEGTGTDTRHIETVDEFSPDWVESISSIGITAGASTPLYAVSDTVLAIKDVRSAKVVG